MTIAEWDLDDLVAHRAPLRLLDRVLEADERIVRAETAIRSDNPFFEPGHGVPAYVGLEMMAQAIAAIDGVKRHNKGLPAKIGFLLGCRRYATTTPVFTEGTRLVITAEMVFGDETMFAFDCRIDDGDARELATGTLKVYAPADPLAFLKGETAA